MKLLGVDLGKITLHKPRTPRRYFSELSGGAALFPIIVLFGLNAVDELDRAAFGVLVPDIRDSFHLSDQGILTLIALTLLGGLLLEIPLAYYADRLPAPGSRCSAPRCGRSSGSSPVSRSRSGCSGSRAAVRAWAARSSRRRTTR